MNELKEIRRYWEFMFVTPCNNSTTMKATRKVQQIPFVDLLKSALHVSGDKLAHPQEHFLTVYTAFGTMCRYCCQPVTRLRWASLSPETCRVEFKRPTNGICWILLVAYVVVRRYWNLEG